MIVRPFSSYLELLDRVSGLYMSALWFFACLQIRCIDHSKESALVRQAGSKYLKKFDCKQIHGSGFLPSINGCAVFYKDFDRNILKVWILESSVQMWIHFMQNVHSLRSIVLHQCFIKKPQYDLSQVCFENAKRHYAVGMFESFLSDRIPLCVYDTSFSFCVALRDSVTKKKCVMQNRYSSYITYEH